MNVLSLFDGMSCGQLALNRLGVQYDNYFASEIDKHAISVTMDNWPKTQQMGDVNLVKGNDLPKIDLLLGGSPCQGFSFAGKRLNFEDPRSKLFFQYVRLLEETNPKYFLLENVKMAKEHEDIITNYLGVVPRKINSSVLCAQKRPRIYWTNMPITGLLKKKHVVVRDIVEELPDSEYRFLPDHLTTEREYHKNYIRLPAIKFWARSFAFFLDKKHGCLDTNPGTGKIVLDDGRIRFITKKEAERLQTVPDNYTKVVTENQAKRMLGNGWTVDVICHLLQNLK